MSALFLAFVFVVGTEAGFRCSIGEWACKATCVVTLQDSGMGGIGHLEMRKDTKRKYSIKIGAMSDR